MYKKIELNFLFEEGQLWFDSTTLAKAMNIDESIVLECHNSALGIPDLSAAGGDYLFINAQYYLLIFAKLYKENPDRLKAIDGIIMSAAQDMIKKGFV